MRTHRCVSALLLALFCFAATACTQMGSPWRGDSRPPLRAEHEYYGEIAARPPVNNTPQDTVSAVSASEVKSQLRDYIKGFGENVGPDAGAEIKPTPVAHIDVLTPSPHVTQVGSMIPISLNGSADLYGERPEVKQPAVPVLQAVSVRAVHDQRQLEVTTAQVTLANTPAHATNPQAPTSIAREIEALERQVESQPGDVRNQLRLRYLYLVEGQKEKALATPKDLGSAEAELLVKMMKVIVTTQENLSTTTSATVEAISAAEELHDWLRANGDLEIPRVALCTAIHSYGNFETIPNNFFVSGGSNRALLYCEVKNFGTETTSDGKYRSRIAHRLELLTPQGHSIWQDQDEMEVVDVCMNRRQDFFFNRLVLLPLGVNPGAYVLKVRIEDKITSKFNEASIEVEIKPAGYASR